MGLSLAAVTLSNIGSGICTHGRPIVALGMSSMCQRPAAWVIAATATKAFAFSLEFLGTCSNCKASQTQVDYTHIPGHALVPCFIFIVYLPHNQLRVASYDDLL